jgi:murein DD-endopeptidase MepM/ murein hydrolase activator NlpD
LRTSVQSLQPGEYVDFETLFFVEVDQLFTIGSEGGMIQSLDGRLSIGIPENALGSATAVGVSRVYGPGRISPTYQLAPEGVYCHQPVTVTMKYDPRRVPPGVMQDDLFLVSGREFPSRMESPVVDKTAYTVSGTVTSFSTVFISHYMRIGKKLSDIPPATGFRLPIGDTSDAVYSCGQEYEVPSENDLGETIGLLDRSSYPNTDEPKIVFNGNEPAKAWQVSTAFNRKRSIGAKPAIPLRSQSLYREWSGVFNNGEDWHFVGHTEATQGLPVHAIADGLVIYNGWGYGKAIALAHQTPVGPIVSVYSHMGEKSHCAVGTVVRKGNVIGKISGSGKDHGYLHFEIGKESLMPVDAKTEEIKVPVTWLGQWSQDSVYENYYDPTNFLLNMMGRYKWSFSVNGNHEGWVLRNIGKCDDGHKYQVRNGALSVKPASSHLEIESYPLNLDVEAFDSVFVTLRSDAADRRAKVYFATDKEPQYSEDKAVGLEIVGEGGFHQHRFFMAGNSKWQGTIVGVRIALENKVVEEAAEVDFDSIRLGRAYLSRIPDTGQTKCYDSMKEITCLAPNAPFYGQDAQYAFISADYEVKTVNGDEVVIDHITGLTWQRDDDGIKRTWREAMDYCENLTWAGYSDWRLPTKKEWQSIANYSGFGPCLDTAIFPYNHGPDECYWSATTLGFLALSASNMCLWDGEPKMRSKGDRNYVRAVRGRPLEFGHFRDNGDGTIIDVTTGIMWQQTETKAMTWEKALAFCENLNLGGHHDWRLPNIRELSSLVDDGRHDPSINTAYFPGCRPAEYWSSTTNALYPAFGWYVGFDDGRVHGGGEKGRCHYVRAVRNVE